MTTEAAQIVALKAEVAELREALRLANKHGSESNPAPCSICGYNGPGYYQTSTHPCVGNANYRALLEKQDG